jgi:hypothetical protein
MPRKYEKVSELLPIVKEMTLQGKTQQQIAEELGLVRQIIFIFIN